MIDLSNLSTEQRNPKSMNPDQMSPLEIATLMNEGDRDVINAIKEVLPQIAKAIELTTASLKAGGRIIYIGAGTSERTPRKLQRRSKSCNNHAASRY